jgi:hypothetical protein
MQSFWSLDIIIEGRHVVVKEREILWHVTTNWYDFVADPLSIPYGTGLQLFLEAPLAF